MARLVALLRGINLGSKRRVAMADLRALLEELGYEDVRTVLASGNVVMTGPKAKARQRLEAALAERFGMDIDVVIRTMDELRAVVKAKPQVERLAEEDFAPDKFAVRRHEIYAWCPDGMQNSRLMKALGKPGLAGTATVRNWATVNKLLE
jgi:uncharacterized protein (DUF1697 family)